VLSVASSLRIGGQEVDIAGPYTPKRDDDEGSCYAGASRTFAPATEQKLETCCWYNSETCCIPQVASLALPKIMGYMTSLHIELGVSDQCYFAISDIICHICAPNTNNFVTVSQNSSSHDTIHICTSFWDKLYGACEKDLSKLIDNAEQSATNGKELCAAVFSNDPDVQPFSFEEDSENCFAGVPLEAVEEAYCLPGQPPRSLPDSVTHWSTIALIILLPVVAFLFCLLVMLSVYLYCLRKRLSEQGDTYMVDTFENMKDEDFDNFN